MWHLGAFRKIKAETINQHAWFDTEEKMDAWWMALHSHTGNGVRDYGNAAMSGWKYKQFLRFL